MASCLFYSFRSSRQVAQILRRRLTTDYYQNAREWIAARSELENFVCNTGTQLECVASSRIPLRLGEEGTLSVAVADLSSVLEAKQAELQIRSVLDDCATIEVFVDKADLVSGSKEQGIVIGLSRQPLSQVELVAEPTHDPFESVDALVCIKPNTASVLRLRVSLPERFGIDVRCGWNDLATTIERCEGSITVQSCKSFLAHRIRANKMDVHVLSGKIDIREMEANAKLFTYGGSLTIQKCSGDTLELDTAGKNQNSKESISIGSLYSKAAKVSSGSGSIEIGTLHGKALLKSESASIKIGGVEGEINVVSNEGKGKIHLLGRDRFKERSYCSVFFLSLFFLV